MLERVEHEFLPDCPRAYTLDQAYTRNIMVRGVGGLRGEGEGGGSASSQRGTIGARVMRRPPTKRSWYAHSALPTVPFARRTTYMLPYTSWSSASTNKPLRLSMHFASFATGSATTDACATDRPKYFPAFRLRLFRAVFSLSFYGVWRSEEKSRRKFRMDTKGRLFIGNYCNYGRWLYRIGYYGYLIYQLHKLVVTIIIVRTVY